METIIVSIGFVFTLLAIMAYEWREGGIIIGLGEAGNDNRNKYKEHSGMVSA
jgi:hypothetical protein